MNYKHFIREISVEPALFFYISSHHVLEFLNTNLFLQKACRFNQTSEPDLNTKCDDDEKGILFTSQVNSNYYSISSAVCLIYLILAVCWSDKAGKRRRPLIFLPIVGQILQAFSGSLHSYFWSWSPTSAAVSNMICQMIGGGHELMIAATQIYVCDVTNLESRTMRVGLVWMIRTIGTPLGKGSSGYILRSVGFHYSYLLCTVFLTISLVLAYMFTKNPSASSESVKRIRFWQIFNFTPIVNSFRIVFKKDLASKRSIISLLLFVQVLGWFALIGEFSVAYLFVKHKFHWDEKMYSTFQVYRHVGIILGTIFCSVVLSRLMKVHDGLIGAFAAFCDTIAVIGYTVASESWHLYAVSLFDVFHGSALSVSSSFMSKFFESHEFGRLFAVNYVFGLLVPISYPVYNIVFRNTLNSFPSAFYILSIVLNIGVFMSYWFSYFLDKKLSKEKSFEKEKEAMVSFTSLPKIVINYGDEISEE